MKKLKLLLLLIFSFIAHIGFSDEMPFEVKRLKNLRDRDVEKIDAAYFRALNKQKKKYATSGNYEAIAYIEKMQIAHIEKEQAARKKAEEPDFKPVKLTQLKPKHVEIGFGNLKINSGANNGLFIKNKPCNEYIFAHADSVLRYDIPQGAKSFNAIGCSAANNRDFSFKVKVDGKTVYECKSLWDSGKTDVDIHVPIPEGSDEIELITDAHGSKYADHSCWAYPEFL